MRGNDIHTNGLSSEKVCVPCAVDDAGRSYAKPGKLGKVSSECIERILGEKIAPGATLYTDQERAYLLYAGRNNLKLMQMDTDCRTVHKDGRINRIKITARHRNVRQIRIRTDKNGIRIMLMYEQAAEKLDDRRTAMGIDLGVDNLVTAGLSTGGAPVILNGRPLKSINRYYNKRRARLQEVAKKSNRLDITNRMERLTEKRNHKIKDYLHKTRKRRLPDSM